MKTKRKQEKKEKKLLLFCYQIYLCCLPKREPKPYTNNLHTKLKFSYKKNILMSALFLTSIE